MIILALLICFVVTYSVIFLITIYHATNDIYTEIERSGDKSEYRLENVTVGKDPISILLIGVEDYETNGQNGRADTLIVVTLNPDTKQMTMTTVPRDTSIEFTEEEVGRYAGFHKINAAYSYGSMFGYGEDKLVIEKVEQLLDIPIDEYVAVNFDGFKDIVDSLDGVKVNIKEPFWEKNFYTPGERLYFEKGERKLNGEEALAFVRMRKRDVNAAYPRDERQRQFIQAIIDEAISTNTLLKVGEITDIVGHNVTTSLSPIEIFHLQQIYSSINTSDIKTFEIEGEDDMIDGIYYVIPTEENLLNISEQLKQELELTTDK
jgi:LCP family protein required for cell wall assembly